MTTSRGTEVAPQRELWGEPEAVGREQVGRGLGGGDYDPVHRHQEVHRDHHEDAGHQDGRAGGGGRPVHRAM